MDNLTSHELLIVIVDFGKGSKIVKHAKQHGITGATIFLGRGTAHNHILKLLDLTEVRKEIILMVAKKEHVHETLESLRKKFRFDKPNYGIAYTMSVARFLGSRHSINQDNKEIGGLENIMYNAIFVIVDKGNAELALDTAVAAGSKGGTIINARGSGIHEQKMLFSIPIEPEKEIVMILSEQVATESIVSAIQGALEIDKPGKGIIFVLDVNQTVGLY